MTIDIRHVALREIELPLKEPFRISSGVTTVRRVLLVQVVDGDGTAGWGECVADRQPNYSHETLDTCRLALQSWVGPLVLGRSFPKFSVVDVSMPT